MTRFAFLTDEFVTEPRRGGGLSSYLDRISRALTELGVEVEIFVKSDVAEPRVIDHGGVRVRQVRPFHPVYSWVGYADKLLLGRMLGGNGKVFATARTLANAFLARHREAPFHAVQATNCSATGLFLPAGPGCRHMVRLSAHRATWRRGDGLAGAPLLEAVERRAVRRADVAYAPSRYMARLYAGDCRDDVAVVRPPAYLEAEPAAEAGVGLPGRYFVHFGQLGRRKGSLAIARALPLVWREAPDFTMVWAGRMLGGEMGALVDDWAARASQVVMTGILPKDRLYTVIRGAEASVLPSLADSLPNTVIESLLLGVPVIGFRGASLPELIDDGVHGSLVDPENVEQLAGAMIRAWRGDIPGKPISRPRVFSEMEPAIAAGRLLRLAGLSR